MITRPEIEIMFRVNVIAVIEMVQLVSRLMARNGGGSIVNIASVTAVLGSPDNQLIRLPKVLSYLLRNRQQKNWLR